MSFSVYTSFRAIGWKVLLLTMLVALISSQLHAASLYKWVDADGNVVYQDTPPPGNVDFEESKVDGVKPSLPTDTGKQIEDAALENPVSLFTVPVCDSCDLVRLLLEKKSIPFAEKDVRNNQETQAELQEISGSLSVPTLVIGSKVLDGFSRIAITQALEDAGFPSIDEAADETAEPSAETESATEAEESEESEEFEEDSIAEITSGDEQSTDSQ